jgi:hypothetical protein
MTNSQQFLAVPPRQAEVIAFADCYRHAILPRPDRNLIEINDGGAHKQPRQLGDIRRATGGLIEANKKLSHYCSASHRKNS